MTLKENLNRLLQSIRDNPRHDLDEIKELVADTSADEIRAASKPFLQLFHTLTDILVETKRPVVGITLLSQAIQKFQQERSQLTPLHSDFCKLCLEAKCLNPALDVLEIDYTNIRKTDEREEDVNRVLHFYYYGGLIYAALKNFDRASYYWEVVLTVPAVTLHPLMESTYKKFLILNLLTNGKLHDNMLPRYTSPCVLRARKQIAQTYLKFSQEYAQLNHDKISRLIAADTAVFEADENMGLMKQCLAQVHKRNINRLTKTFLTLRLRDVATYVGLGTERDAELFLLGMIDDGEITAIIDQKNGMVIFKDDSEKYDSVAVFHKLQEDMAVTTNLVKTLKKVDAENSANLPADTRAHSKVGEI